MNDLDVCLDVVSRSREPLRYIWLWISWKPLEIEAWFQRTTNRKWHMGYQIVTWPMTSRDPQRCCEAVRSANLATAWLLVIQAQPIIRHAWCNSHLQWLRNWPTMRECSCGCCYFATTCALSWQPESTGASRASVRGIHFTPSGRTSSVEGYNRQLYRDRRRRDSWLCRPVAVANGQLFLPSGICIAAGQ